VRWNRVIIGASYSVRADLPTEASGGQAVGRQVAGYVSTVLDRIEEGGLTRVARSLPGACEALKLL